MKKYTFIVYLICFLVALTMPVMGENTDDENKSLSKSPKGTAYMY